MTDEETGRHDWLKCCVVSDVTCTDHKLFPSVPEAEKQRRCRNRSRQTADHQSAAVAAAAAVSGEDTYTSPPPTNLRWQPLGDVRMGTMHADGRLGGLWSRHVLKR